MRHVLLKGALVRGCDTKGCQERWPCMKHPRMALAHETMLKDPCRVPRMGSSGEPQLHKCCGYHVCACAPRTDPKHDGMVGPIMAEACQKIADELSFLGRIAQVTWDRHPGGLVIVDIRSGGLRTGFVARVAQMESYLNTHLAAQGDISWRVTSIRRDILADIKRGEQQRAANDMDTVREHVTRVYRRILSAYVQQQGIDAATDVSFVSTTHGFEARFWLGVCCGLASFSNEELRAYYDADRSAIGPGHSRWPQALAFEQKMAKLMQELVNGFRQARDVREPQMLVPNLWQGVSSQLKAVYVDEAVDIDSKTFGPGKIYKVESKQLYQPMSDSGASYISPDAIKAIEDAAKKCYGV